MRENFPFPKGDLIRPESSKQVGRVENHINSFINSSCLRPVQDGKEVSSLGPVQASEVTWSSGMGRAVTAHLSGRGTGCVWPARRVCLAQEASGGPRATCPPSLSSMVSLYLKAQPCLSERGKLFLHLPKYSIIRHFQGPIEPFLAGWQSQSSFLPYHTVKASSEVTRALGRKSHIHFTSYLQMKLPGCALIFLLLKKCLCCSISAFLYSRLEKLSGCSLKS